MKNPYRPTIENLETLQRETEAYYKIALEREQLVNSIVTALNEDDTQYLKNQLEITETNYNLRYKIYRSIKNDIELMYELDNLDQDHEGYKAQIINADKKLVELNKEKETIERLIKETDNIRTELINSREEIFQQIIEKSKGLSGYL